MVTFKLDSIRSSARSFRAHIGAASLPQLCCRSAVHTGGGDRGLAEGFSLYCTPGWDGLCHGDASYIVDSGLLVVQVPRGGESWLCRENCTLEVRFWQHTGLDLVMLQPVELGECHFAEEQTQLFESMHGIL